MKYFFIIYVAISAFTLVSCKSTSEKPDRLPSSRGGFFLESIESDRVKQVIREHVVKLTFVNQNDKSAKPVVCSGAIMSQKWILTAAHCITEVFDYSQKEKLKIVVSRLDGNEQDQILFDTTAESVSLHPDYLSQRLQGVRVESRTGDLALVRVPDQILPAELAKLTIAPIKSQVVNVKALIAGYGIDPLNPEAKNPNALRVAPVTLLARKGRRDVLPRGVAFSAHDNNFLENLPRGTLLMKDSIHGSCVGDSGGPVFLLTEGGDLQITGVNFTGNCGKSLEVFGKTTDITFDKNADFIESNLGADADFASSSENTVDPAAIGIANRFNCSSTADVQAALGSKGRANGFRMDPSKAYELTCPFEASGHFSVILFRDHVVSGTFKSLGHYCESCLDTVNNVGKKSKECFDGQGRCILNSNLAAPLEMYNDNYAVGEFTSSQGKFNFWIPSAVFNGDRNSSFSIVVQGLPIFPVCEAKIFKTALCKIKEESISKISQKSRARFKPYLKIDPTFKF